MLVAGAPREQVAEVVAVACELPIAHGRPLVHFTCAELHRLVIERAITHASATTIWRWLHDAALKPWQQRSWIFPRDPAFAAKAGRVLDLYARRCDGELLHPGDFVVCADEKSQPQALGRRYPTVPAAPGRPALVEFEYRRADAGLPGRLGRPPHPAVRPGRAQDGDRTTEPYTSARRVFWVVDNGSSRAGRAAIDRCRRRGPART